MFYSNNKMDIKSALITFLVVGLALTIPCGAGAQDANNGVPGDWLSRYASPRATGLGGAMVAVGDEPSAALWNPAGISWLRQNELQVGSVRLFDDTSINSLGFARPSSRMPSLAFNLLSLKSGEFERTNELNESLGTFDEGDLVMALTVAQALTPRWSVGANLKLAKQTVEDFSGSGMGFDLGIMGQVTGGLMIGASALNLGGPKITLREKEESYANEYRGGLALTMLEGRSLTSVEMVHRDGPGTQPRVGTEFWIQSLALRVGYYIEDIAAGFSYRFRNGLQFDYGMADHELGMTHRFGLNYRFGGYYADSNANPEIFSPTGQNPVTKFLLASQTKADAKDWQLTIWDKSGQVVRSYAGQGNPPAHVIWDGKGETGMPLPDGKYRYQLRVTDLDGRIMEGLERTVEISTGGPSGSIGVQ
ncbi:MAG: PorV/PorQ family protein [Candidatus Krumholzibacteriota bacterium]